MIKWELQMQTDNLKSSENAYNDLKLETIEWGSEKFNLRLEDLNVINEK